ncbi:hypothetical protein BH11ACT6_BH11ACT6_59620 [soil metagenome]
MTVPDGNSGGQPGDQTGEDPSSGAFEAPPTTYPPPAHGAPGPSPYPAGGYPPPEGYGWGAVGAPVQQTATNTMAIASLVFSVLGIVPFCGGILSIVGITLGTVALSQIKETRQEGYGLAVSGIVVGVAMLIVGLIWTIFALR